MPLNVNLLSDVVIIIIILKGGAPSPFDRNFGTKLGVRAVQWLTETMAATFRQGKNNNTFQIDRLYTVVHTTLNDVCRSGSVFANSPDTACVLGLNGKALTFSPVAELKELTDFE